MAEEIMPMQKQRKKKKHTHKVMSLNSAEKVQECDATMFNSSTKAKYKI